jgi:signal transduction histidine kinase
MALVVLALALAAPMGLMFQQAPTAPLFAAILAAAWLTGFGPAIVAATIGVVALEAFDRIRSTSVAVARVDARDIVWTLLFFGIVLGMAWLASTIRRLEDDRGRLLTLERAARVQAETASRARDDFLAIVSHELRSPLTTVLSWIHVLKSGTLEASKTRHAIDVIERNTLLQARLIDDLLDVSRAVAGKLDFVVERLDMAAVVQQLVQSFEPKAQAAGVAMETATTARLVVLGDAIRLQQVVGNLISNALKFTDAGGRVHVRTRRHEAFVELTVRDTGEGIDAATLPHVFGLFHQGPSALGRRQGLGLGLTIAKHIVELHGGSIAAESPGPGQGTTFIVRLPLAP